MCLLDLLPTYYFVRHHVLPSLKQHSKSGNHEGRNADEDHIQQE